jgi:hypothetical protein
MSLRTAVETYQAGSFGLKARRGAGPGGGRDGTGQNMFRSLAVSGAVKVTCVPRLQSLGDTQLDPAVQILSSLHLKWASGNAGEKVMKIEKKNRKIS